MTRGRTPSADGWITIGVKVRASDVKRLDVVRGSTSRSEWMRSLALASLRAAEDAAAVNDRMGKVVDVGTVSGYPPSEIIAPGAFAGTLPAEVPVTRRPGGTRIGTAQVSETGQGLSFSMKIDCPHPKARRSKGGLCMACGKNVA